MWSGVWLVGVLRGVVGRCGQGCGWWVCSVLRLVGVVRGMAGGCGQCCGW